MMKTQYISVGERGMEFMKGKRLWVVLAVFLIGVVIFLLETQYVTCDMYLFRHEKFGHKLIIVNGIDHIGDEIDIDNEKIQLGGEIIKYSQKKEGKENHFYLEKEDGTKREVIGVSKDLASFKSANDGCYAGVSSDGSTFDELKFYSAILMSYVAVRRLFVNLMVCVGIVVLFIAVAAFCHKSKK